MERLTTLYEGESLKVLVKNEQSLLLLVGNRHVKYEKTDLCFLNALRLSTSKSVLNAQDVANIVRESYRPFYSTDIETIVSKPDCFEIVIKDDVYIHRGSFYIYKE
ncbi:hypothetical protein CF8_0123 [Aeromonas phage CF8]|nr:hypothetical protein CF8_0123 [Aeromonas phage CF8]